jgi:hypothetical protein
MNAPSRSLRQGATLPVFAVASIFVSFVAFEVARGWLGCEPISPT